MEYIMRHDWPGNVRELLNIIIYALSLAEGNTIKPEHLPPDLVDGGGFEVKKEIRELKDALALSPQFTECLQILRQLKRIRLDKTTAGRKKLAESCRNEGIMLTEEKIRARLKKMAQLGLVALGTTRQGCTITQKGLEFLACCQTE